MDWKKIHKHPSNSRPSLNGGEKKSLLGVKKEERKLK